MRFPFSEVVGENNKARSLTTRAGLLELQVGFEDYD
jgi:hypothetical protein